MTGKGGDCLLYTSVNAWLQSRKMANSTVKMPSSRNQPEPSIKRRDDAKMTISTIPEKMCIRDRPMVVWISVQIPMTRKHALIMVGRTVAASRPARDRKSGV